MVMFIGCLAVIGIARCGFPLLTGAGKGLPAGGRSRRRFRADSNGTIAG
jgi:hypothetical protein